MKFTLLISIVLAVPLTHREEVGLLDGLLGSNNHHRHHDRDCGLLGNGGLLGTGIGTKHGLLRTGILTRIKRHRHHCGHHKKHHH